MKIGQLVLETGAPDAERLLSSTGCSRARMTVLLGSPVLASTVAAALLACAKGDTVPARSDLARAIAAAGVDRIRAKVLALYAPRQRARKKETPSVQTED